MTPAPLTAEALVEALAYLKPHETNGGTISLKAAKAREAVAIFEASLQRVTAERDERDKRIAELTETWTDESGHTWSPPTAWAYAAVCAALHKRREQADTATAEAARLRGDVEALKDALTLCLAELDWQVGAAEHCGDPDCECPMQDIGKPSGEHMQARNAARTALARAATEEGQADA